jgi:L-arabinokinase
LLCVYVSGHGYGHATRTAQVLRVVRERAPRLLIEVSTSAPGFLFEAAVAPPLRLRALECDPGVAQRDALEIDEAATVRRCLAFRERAARLVAAEAAHLRARGARAVLGDIPPLAFAAAAEAGVPSLALANFSWDWIYRHLSARHAALVGAAAEAAADYARAGRLLRLPFAGDLSAFASVEDIPLVARRPETSRPEARRRLGLDGGRPTILLSFGGVGLPGLEARAFADLAEYQLLLTGAPGLGEAPPNLRRLDGAALSGAGLGYCDLVAAADVVVSKPGYGIVSDCIGARTPLVYTDRGDFPEYPILVREMPRHLAVRHVGNEDLRRGRLREAVEDVRTRPMPEAPDLGGAERAADRVLEAASA